MKTAKREALTPTIFQDKLMSIIYLRFTPVDSSQAIFVLSKKSKTATGDDAEALKHLLRYIKSNQQHQRIFLRKNFKIN